MATHKYESRTQAELEARDYSADKACTVVTYKLEDGRYQNVSYNGTGSFPVLATPDPRGDSAVAKYTRGVQVF